MTAELYKLIINEIVKFFGYFITREVCRRQNNISLTSLKLQHYGAIQMHCYYYFFLPSVLRSQGSLKINYYYYYY